MDYDEKRLYAFIKEVCEKEGFKFKPPSEDKGYEARQTKLKK